MTQTSLFSISHVELRRLVRVGATVVLEAVTTYPCLMCKEEKNECMTKEILRFNDAYRNAADAFLAWCECMLAETAKSDFLMAGVGAVYTFDRRTVQFSAMATEDENGEILVRRRVTLGNRRGGVVSSKEQIDHWRRADLTFVPPGRGKKSTE